jgi:hypothetical protein
MDYSNRTLAELKKLCNERAIRGYSNKKKSDLVTLLQKHDATPIPPPFKMTSAVLELCPIPESLNKEQLTECINKYMSEARLDFHRKSKPKRAPFIESVFAEFYVAECTNGKVIGGGSCAMDVQTQHNEGIDTTSITMHESISNEKSLMQKLKGSGKDLDQIFKDKRHNEAVNILISEYSKKMECVKKDKGLEHLYILIFISNENDMFLACFKINLENIQHVLSGGFVNDTNEECVNITVNNFIDPSYGNVKLYKSKKRVELRLLPSVLKSEHVVKIYTMPQISP